MEPSNPNDISQFNSHQVDTGASNPDTKKSFIPTTSVRERQTTAINATKTLPDVSFGSPYPVAPAPRHPRKRILMVALGIGAIAFTIAGVRWWQHAATHQETDDAYVTGHIHPVNSRITGTVSQVLVDDNQIVSQGQLLVQLDPRDYQVALQQAQASLETARHQADVAQANIEVTATNAQGQTTVAQGNIDAAAATIATSEAALAQAHSGVPAAQANLAQVEANLVKAKLDYDRYISLVQSGASPRQQLDAAKASYEALVAQRNAMREQIRQAQAQVEQAEKNLNNAQAKLASTKGTLEQANSATKQTEANRRQYQATLAANRSVTSPSKKCPTSAILYPDHSTNRR